MSEFAFASLQLHKLYASVVDANKRLIFMNNDRLNL
ncbi:hypothetical protein ACE41H_08835 [Paenibacillus enshidis]|uniref:Uncharacterized protein n=1 Tax=Paenibacillus enshidis TaxID=1458439 RepID=A0ABV5AS85_9BACL